MHRWTARTLTLLAACAVLLIACDGGGPVAFEGDDPGECSDAADNDRDGDFDCDDSDCAASPSCRGGDAGSMDAGSMDAGSIDAGSMDAGSADAGTEVDGSIAEDGGGLTDGGALTDAAPAPDGSTPADGGTPADASMGSDAGPPPPALAFRLGALTGEDPEVYGSYLGVCSNATALANSLLEPSEHAIVFPSYDPTSTTQAAQLVTHPSCSASSCSAAASSIVTPFTATLSMTSGDACLEPIAGTTATSYTADRPVHPCFVSSAFDVSIVTSQDDVPLHDARLAASFVAGSPETLVDGLLYGFISETDAQLVEFTISGVTRTLWQMLPGGGGCRGGDQRDMHEGVSGWWLYFHFQAEEIGWTP